MSKPRHTPGPWTYTGNVFEAIKDASGEIVVYGLGPGSINQTDANARLIAAAPELLKALEKVRVYLLQRTIDNPEDQEAQLALIDVQVAMEKAEGKNDE